MRRAEVLSDEEIMRRVREGEVSLLSDLFQRHHRTLFRFCWRMTGHTQRSEDLVQEVFLRILRHRDSFSGASFTAWMYSIARNVSSDAWRKGRRELPLEGEASGASDGEEDAERGIEAARLREALLALPADKREVLVMSRYMGMSHAEIGEALGCDEGTSRARLFRAMHSLREVYLARRPV